MSIKILGKILLYELKAVRNINRQVEADYDRIKEISEEMAESAAKNILAEVMALKDELFD